MHVCIRYDNDEKNVKCSFFAPSTPSRHTRKIAVEVVMLFRRMSGASLSFDFDFGAYTIHVRDRSELP